MSIVNSKTPLQPDFYRAHDWKVKSPSSSADRNEVTIAGILVDRVVRQANDGVTVASFSVETSFEKYRNRLPCVARGPLAKLVSEMPLGDRIAIRGHLQNGPRSRCGQPHCSRMVIVCTGGEVQQ